MIVHTSGSSSGCSASRQSLSTVRSERRATINPSVSNTRQSSLKRSRETPKALASPRKCVSHASVVTSAAMAVCRAPRAAGTRISRSPKSINI
jgi:hypothetical protein